MAHIAIVAHAPLASVMGKLVAHVYQSAEGLSVFDIQSDEDPNVARRRIVSQLHDTQASEIMLLTDLCGATPSNLGVESARLLESAGCKTRVLCGLNACMVLAAYANHERLDLDALTSKVAEGARDGVRCLKDGTEDGKCQLEEIDND